jgi:hypothetical protein
MREKNFYCYFKYLIFHVTFILFLRKYFFKPKKKKSKKVLFFLWKSKKKRKFSFNKVNFFFKKYDDSIINQIKLKRVWERLKNFFFFSLEEEFNRRKGEKKRKKIILINNF